MFEPPRMCRFDLPIPDVREANLIFSFNLRWLQKIIDLTSVFLKSYLDPLAHAITLNWTIQWHRYDRDDHCHPQLAIQACRMGLWSMFAGWSSHWLDQLHRNGLLLSTAATKNVKLVKFVFSCGKIWKVVHSTQLWSLMIFACSTFAQPWGQLKPLL